MKKGKKLLVLLVAALMIAAFSVVSFAASDSATYREAQVGNATLSVEDVDYDGSAHEAVLEETITDKTPDSYAVSQAIEGHRPYGDVSEIFYYKSDEAGSQLGSCSAPVEAGYYLARVTVTIYKYDGTDYKTETHDLTVKYQIRKAKLDVVWDDAKLVYNGEPQFPTASANGVDGKKITLVPAPADPDKDPCIDAGEHTAVATLSDADAKNYTLNETGATKHYTIERLPVELKWYRPVYDEYGEPTGLDQPVDDDLMIKLVYNGQSQSPIARIENVAEGDSDKVNVVTEGEAIEANTYNPSKYYIAKAVGITGSRAKNYTFEDDIRPFQIVARPVHLKWGYIPAEGEDAVHADVVDSSRSSYDYVTTYNGYRQDAIVDVINPGADENNYADDITIEEVSVDYSQHHDGTDIDEDRIFTDAGVYNLTPGALSDDRNYTLYALEYDDESGDITVSDEYVDDYEATYTIEQYVIERISWDEDSLTKVYTGSYQVPTATLGDELQGPDTDEEVTVVPVCTSRRSPVNVGSYGFTVGYTLNHISDVDRSINYHISRRTTEDRNATMTIVPADLTVTANNKTITYGQAPSDNGLSFSGLENGRPDVKCLFNELSKEEQIAYYEELFENYDINQGDLDGFVAEIEKDSKLDYNKDEEGGVPTVHETYAESEGTSIGVFVNSVDGEQAPVEAKDAIGFRFTYAQNGKPGSYAIIPYLKEGYSAPNYNIKFVNGTLKVNDKVSTLVAKGTKKGSRAVKISWNSVTGAASYDVYASRCSTPDKKYTPKHVATVKGNSYKLKKLKGKKLNKNTCYKYYVVAKNAAGVPIATSMTGHCITGNVRGKTVNAKSMTVNTASVSVGKGGTAKLSASYKKAKSGKKYKLNNNAHSALTRFVSENPEVATVDANGIVKGVSTGWCRVYVQGVSGMWKAVEVYVK